MSEEIKTKHVSDSKIVVPRIHKEKAPVKAGDIFAVPFSNIFICAMKNSGKSTVLTNIIWKCIGRNTKVIVICSTVDKDPTWKHTIEKLRDKDYSVTTLTEITDPQDKVNALQEFMNENNNDNESASEEEQQEEEFKPPAFVARKNRQQHVEPMPTAQGFQIRRNRPPLQLSPPPAPPPSPVEEVKEEKPKKTKKLAKIIPEWIIVLDDLGDALRDKALTQLMKTNRHYKALVIISSQNLNDLQPAALRQVGYCLLFARFSEDKLEELYKKLDITLPYERFRQLYKDATKAKYSFLFIGRAEGVDEFRKGFTERYIL